MPGSSRPSSGGVTRACPRHDPDVRQRRLEDVAVEVHEQRQRAEPLGSSASSRRSRHLCAPSPPGRKAGASVTGSAAARRPAAEVELHRRRLAEASTCRRASAMTRGDGHARPDPRAAVRRTARSCLREPGQMGGGVDRRAAAHQDGREHPERGVGPVGLAREGGHRRRAGSRARLVDPAVRRPPRSRGAPSRSTPRARAPDRSRPRCRRRRPARRSPRSSRVRIATFNSRPATGLTKPTAPVYASRPPASSSAITRIAWIFGAPVTDPGGKLARRGPRPRRPAGACPPPSTRGATHPGAGRGSFSAVTRDRPVLAHAPEVVAHQVHDHHVLGAVLVDPSAARASSARVPPRPERARGAVP